MGVKGLPSITCYAHRSRANKETAANLSNLRKLRRLKWIGAHSTEARRARVVSNFRKCLCPRIDPWRNWLTNQIGKADNFDRRAAL
jgi:hypothetical protein